MDLNNVKSLRVLSFKALYSLIASSLPPNAKPPFKVNNSSSTGGEPSNKKKKLLPKDQLVADIREYLDEYLVGVYSHFRKKLLIEFNKQLLEGDKQTPDLCFFLDCVLDDSFIKFKNNPQCVIKGEPITSSQKQSKILTVISSRCPQLSHFKTWNLNLRPQGCQNIFLSSLKKLEHLTHLELDCSFNDDNLFFSQLGEACPKLTHLILGHDKEFKQNQQINLVLGPRAKLFLQYVGDVQKTDWAAYQFNEDSITPICKILKYLKTNQRIFGIGTELTSQLCFLLRHMPQLEELDVADRGLGDALLLFYRNSRRRWNNALKPWSRCAGPIRVQWTTNSIPPGKISCLLIDKI